MSKLAKIKAELAKLLVKYTAVKTDNGILEYEGEELVAGMNVYVTNEEGDKIAPADGEYKTEDNKVITVKDGKVESIVDPVAEVEAEEKPSDSEDDKPEEVVEEPKEDKPTEEPKDEEPKEDDKVELEDVNEAIDNLRKEVDELYKLVDSILKKVGETRDEADERLKKLECASQAKPAADEFEQLTAPKKTGDSKLDKFLANFGN